MKTKLKMRQGFTLIELLLVLVIIGVLAAIIAPKLVGRSEQARIAATKAQIANFETALEAFEVDNGYFPKGKSGLNDLVSQPKDAANWKGPYLQSIPNDPWNHSYVYEYPGKHNEKGYDITSAGPDGKLGSDDDLSNWQNKR